MEINNPNTANTWVSDDGTSIHIKRIAIGAWNMDTTASIIVAHGMGVTVRKLLNISVQITDDTQLQINILNRIDITGGDTLVQGGIDTIDPTNVRLWRADASYFDSVDFDNVAINRGYITIMYYQ